MSTSGTTKPGGSGTGRAGCEDTRPAGFIFHYREHVCKDACTTRGRSSTVLGMDAAALIVSSLGVTAGLVTLSLVIRNELRERRRHPPVAWGFHRYAAATVDGVACEVGELVQYGRMPTHLLQYTAVGFALNLQEGYRVRRYVKAEDTMPLFLTDVDHDRAWMLVMHCPQDDRRFVYFHSVELEPTSDVYRAREGATIERLREEHRTWSGRAQRLRWRYTSGSVVRPVGPDGYQWARLRIDSRKRVSDPDVALIVSVAKADGGLTSSPY